MNDSLDLKGNITLELRGPDGQLKDVRNVQNNVTNAGRQAIIDRLQGNTPAVAQYIAIGTGTTAPTAADTTMQTQVARSLGTFAQPDAHTDSCSVTFAAGTGTGAITECGRLNDPTAGTLYGRQTFAAVNKGASDSLTVTYDFTYAAG